MKAMLQFAAIVILFIATWFGFSRIDFVRIFHLNSINKKMERKIGDAIIDAIESGNDVIKSDSLDIIYNKIMSRLCSGTILNSDEIKLHLVKSDQINAYALPGNNIVINTRLIEKCDSASELCGIIAHETGHLELHHVMKRIIGETGISVITSMATNGNSVIAARIAKHLSTKAFERDQEREADAFAVKCLNAANIGKSGFENFMLKMAKTDGAIPDKLEWVSTHPDSKERVANIRSSKITSPKKYIQVLNDTEWAYLKKCAIQKQLVNSNLWK